MKRGDRGDGLDRRSFLAAGLTGAAVASSGCIESVRSVVTGEDETLSLSITTVPTDDDRASIQLAHLLESRLESAGIHVTLDPKTYPEFLRSVLIDHDFDLYVGRHPGGPDPDFLYEALHSVYANEVGWQNPFGFTNVTFDELLERQRLADGDQRRDAVASMLTALVEEKPFVPLCIPEEFRLARTDRFAGLEDAHLSTRLGYLGLEPAEDADDTDQLRAILTDARPTVNQNPFASEYRAHSPVVDLCYDSLAVHRDGEYQPWLAESWTWNEVESDARPEPVGAHTPLRSNSAPEAGRELTAEVTLRERCRFHDGEPVTASDVAFTYAFLTDTSLGRADAPVPPTRYRGLGHAVRTVDVLDDRTVEFTFDAGTAVARQALTVPILPEHVWGEVIESVPENQLPSRQRRWEPLTSGSVPPIGSGPYVHVNSEDRDFVTLERFDEHFTLRESVDLPGPTVEEIQFDVYPNNGAAVQDVAAGRFDVTASPLESYVYEDARNAETAEFVKSESWAFYLVGFNVRRSPFGNPYVRRTIAQLLDPESVVEEVFGGRARPVSVPVEEEWIPASLRWDGADPVSPFLGTDGELDVEAAKEAFESIGFRYDQHGRFVVGN